MQEQSEITFKNAQKLPSNIGGSTQNELNTSGLVAQQRQMERIKMQKEE
jgi:ATP-dependent Zn protease